MFRINISKKEFKIVILIVIALLVAFAFLDLPISQAVYSPGNWFGRLFEIIGELPAALVAAFSGAIIMLFHQGQSSVKKVITSILGCFFWLSGSLMCGIMPLL